MTFLFDIRHGVERAVERADRELHQQEWDALMQAEGCNFFESAPAFTLDDEYQLLANLDNARLVA